MNIIIAPSWPQNLPKQLGATVWYDACKSGVLEAGNKVSSLTDLTGNNFNCIQSTDSKRPVWTDKQQHGRPVLVFSAANQTDLLSSNNWTGGQAATIIVVCRTTTNNVNQPIFGCYDSSAVRKPALRFDTTNKVTSAFRTNAASVSSRTSNETYYNIPIIVTTTINVASTSDEVPLLSINGITTSTNVYTANTSNLGGYKLNIGATGETGTSVYMTGWVSEIMLFDSILSSTNIVKIEKYLSQKWGIKLA